MEGFNLYNGIKGGIGGEMRMNEGEKGVEKRERVVEVREIERKGEVNVI